MNLKEKSQITIYSLLTKWLCRKSEEMLAPSTMRCYELACRHICQYIQNVYMDVIKERDLQNILNLMGAQGYSHSTIDKVKIVLNQAFIFAVQEEYLQYNPINKLRTPKNAPVMKVDALTKTEQQKVEELCLSPKYKNNVKFKATLFLLHTGLRISELLNLCWQNVFSDGRNPYIYIEKSKTVYGRRIVPLDETALEIIYSLPHISKYVFSYGGGRPLSQTMMKKHNQQIREITHISNMTNHICRHSYATRLVEKNINIKVLSKVMGHSTVSFTLERYCSVSTDYIFNEMNKIMLSA